MAKDMQSKNMKLDLRIKDYLTKGTRLPRFPDYRIILDVEDHKCNLKDIVTFNTCQG